MTFFAGHAGNIRLRRDTKVLLPSAITIDDVNTSLNRIGFDGSIENILTGDRLVIATDDPRGLVCFPASVWTTGQIENTFSSFVNVNAAGGLRFFPTFVDAINNVRANEYPTVAFSGATIPIDVSVRDATANILGSVQGYTINTDREAIDTTTLNDKFRQQYSAGLISGGGAIDCIFNSQISGLKETSLLMLQLIQRIDIGSVFDCAIYLTDPDNDNRADSVFYEFTGVVTKSGLSVQAGELITCSIDFITAGDIRLLVGQPANYVLQESEDRIVVEPGLDFLLKEIED
jgi:hypothetical protein